jgi:hypothetical protein
MLLILLSSAAFAPAPPSPVMQCLEKACPSQIAACQADATCEKGIQCVLACAPGSGASACVDACIQAQFGAIRHNSA